MRLGDGELPMARADDVMPHYTYPGVGGVLRRTKTISQSEEA